VRTTLLSIMSFSLSLYLVFKFRGFCPYTPIIGTPHGKREEFSAIFFVAYVTETFSSFCPFGLPKESPMNYNGGMRLREFQSLAELNSEHLIGKDSRPYRSGLYEAVATYKANIGCEYPTGCTETLWRSNPVLLDLDHTAPANKSGAVSDLVQKATRANFQETILGVWQEINKCRVLCAAHHRLVTFR
jgi:hypothetical protein